MIAGHHEKPARRRTRRILLAEDEPFLRDVLTRCLSALGYDVCTVPDGAVAWDRFQAEPFDVVVTDQLMPRMTGLELSACIRHAGSDVPVILITGFTDVLPGQAMEASGVSNLLSKPFTPSQLSLAIQQALGQAAATV